MNALDLELLDAVVATMGHLDGPVLVTGAGNCFSAGVDLRAILDGGSEYTDRFITSLSAALLAAFDPLMSSVVPGALVAICFALLFSEGRLSMWPS